MQAVTVLEPKISVEELQAFETRYNKEVYQPYGASVEAKFEYAWALARSEYIDDVRRSVSLFRDLIVHDQNRRESTFFLAATYLKLNDTKNAREIVHRMLQEEPTNPQALALQKAIEKTLKKDAATGMALVGGSAVVAGLAIAALVVGLKRK